MRRAGAVLLVLIGMSTPTRVVRADVPPAPVAPAASPTASPAPATAAPAGPASTPGAAASPPAAPPTEQAVAEAKQRYRRALELFDEGSFDAAQLEMRRAYALAPSYRMLYNLGLISVQLNDYAAALDFFQRYISEGGSEVPADRLADVEQRMEKLRGRVGFIRIATNVPAEISVDDVVVAQSPLAKPVRVNAGRRKVGARAAGRIPESKIVEVAGGDNASVTLTLVDPTVVAVQRPEAPARPEMWIAWGATGGLAVGTTVFALLASSANSDYKTRQNTFGVTSGELHDASRKAAGLSLTADLLGAATILSAAAAVYFTVRPKGAKAEAAEPSSTETKKPEKRDTEEGTLYVRPGAASLHVGATF